MAGAGIFLLLLVYVFALGWPFPSREPQRRTQLLSNVRYVARAHQLYLAEHDDRFAPREDWQGSLRRFVKNEAIYSNPFTEKKNALGLNIYLSTLTMILVQNPEEVILHYPTLRPRNNASGEQDDLWTGPRGGHTLAFADGRARELKREVAIRANNWKP